MTINYLIRSATAGCTVMAALACAQAETPERADAAASSQSVAPVETAGAVQDGVVQGTPPGGLARWIEEIRQGLDTLPQLAVRDAAAAKNQALQLYVSRQEYLEIYYGTTGRAVKDAELAESVMTAEARFHDLLRVVNPPDGQIRPDSLRAAAAALGAQYERVLHRAGQLELDVSQLELAGGEAAR